MSENTQTHAIHKKPALLNGTERIELHPGILRAGRDSQNDLVLEDAALSRHHFLIDLQLHQAQLVDLGSANGTYVNKKRVRSAWLKDGDRIRVGDRTLLFEAPGFLLGQALFEESESTCAKTETRSKQGSASFLSLLALAVACSSLFIQVLNYDLQLDQERDLQIIRQASLTHSIQASLSEDKPQEVLDTPEKRWQKALSEFKSGDEDGACSRVKNLIPDLSSKDILREKARSFFERKCVF